MLFVAFAWESLLYKDFYMKGMVGVKVACSRLSDQIVVEARERDLRVTLFSSQVVMASLLDCP